jgi:hypothetical protein
MSLARSFAVAATDAAVAVLASLEVFTDLLSCQLGSRYEQNTGSAIVVVVRFTTPRCNPGGLRFNPTRHRSSFDHDSTH